MTGSDHSGVFCRTAQRKGFTLIELLVVIAIIAILAAILFPVFNRAREAGRMARCMANMKQMASATDLYKDDYNACFPSSGTYPTNSAYPGYGWGFWMPMLQRYSRSKDLFRCPSATDRYAFQSEQAHRTHYSAANYGYNEYLIYHAWGNFWMEGSVPRPSKTMLIADSSWLMIMNWFSVTGPDGVTLPNGMLRAKYANTPVSAFSANWATANGLWKPRHPNAVNVIFADGHARAIRMEEFRYEGHYQPCTPDLPPPKEYPMIYPLSIELK